MDLNSVVHATAIGLAHEPVRADQSVRGEPTTGSIALGDFDGMEIGVWEMTPGAMRDVETDEVFIVIAGAATVEFPDGAPTLHLRVGDVVRLAKDTKTVWTVSETLRKVYVVG